MIAWYALVGVMLGVATLIVVQAVMIGFREEFTDRIKQTFDLVYSMRALKK